MNRLHHWINCAHFLGVKICRPLITRLGWPVGTHILYIDRTQAKSPLAHPQEGPNQTFQSPQSIPRWAPQQGACGEHVACKGKDYRNNNNNNLLYLTPKRSQACPYQLINWSRTLCSEYVWNSRQCTYNYILYVWILIAYDNFAQIEDQNIRKNPSEISFLKSLESFCFWMVRSLESWKKK